MYILFTSLVSPTRLMYPVLFLSFDYSAEKTEASVMESLRCMRLEYIDLIQIHDVEFAPSLDCLLHQTIPALVRLKRKGLVRAIGITGKQTETTLIMCIYVCSSYQGRC